MDYYLFIAVVVLIDIFYIIIIRTIIVPSIIHGVIVCCVDLFGFCLFFDNFTIVN